MENSSTKSKINCVEVVGKLGKLGKLKTSFAEYEVALNSPDIRDSLPTGIKLSEEVESSLLKLEEILHPEYILEIDRSFSIVDDFLKKPKTEGGLGIEWLGSKNPIAESEERNEGLTEIDLSKVRLDTGWFRDELKDKDGYVFAVKRLEDLKKRDIICLDLFVFASLWKLLKGTEEQKKEFENKLTIIAEANGTKLDDLKKKCLSFDGTIIRDMDGDRHMLSLYWKGSGWGWDIDSRRGSLGDRRPSLVLTS
jgi:hypothetical protein